MAFNGGGSALAGAGDPLTAKFADPAVRDAFGYVNHTLDHPNLDCSTASFIRRQITDNLAWARARGLPVASASEVVTGEHSGLANARPGNPGTIDPPTFDDVEPLAGGGAVAAGTYDYALTARSPAGETVALGRARRDRRGRRLGRASASPRSATPSATTSTGARPGPTAWARVATLARAGTAPTDDGDEPITLSVTDAAAARDRGGAAGRQRRRARPVRPEPGAARRARTPPGSATSPPTPRRPTRPCRR